MSILAYAIVTDENTIPGNDDLIFSEDFSYVFFHPPVSTFFLVVLEHFFYGSVAVLNARIISHNSSPVPHRFAFIIDIKTRKTY